MLWGLATLVFFLSRLLPGDPSNLFLAPGIPPAVVTHVKAQFGLDQPPLVQYALWLRSVAQGDLGYSFAHGAPVTDVLKSAFPNTALLGLSALIVETLLAISIVWIAVAWVGPALDRFIGRLTLVVYSLPSFWIGILLLILFAFTFKIFPSSQMYSTGPAQGAGSFIDLLSHLVLPALTVAIPGAATLARYLRTNVTETLREDYVLAARSMGLSKGTVFRLYVLPNSLGPVVSLLGIEIGILLTGVVVTETLFSWPGMGRVAVMSIFARDYPLVLGCTLLGGVVVILANLLADLLRAMLDPRLRVE